MNVHFSRAVACCTLVCAAALPLAAQNIPIAAPRNQGDSADRVLRGRAQMDANDPGAVAALRDASQAALQALVTVTGGDGLRAAPHSLAEDVLTSGTARKAAEAHLYWGQAADKFAQRDESITALARAVRLAQAVGVNDSETQFLRRDTSNELGRVLREGLPLVAPDDTLETIAEIAHGGLWKPLRFRFDSGSGTPEEFLLTQGKIFPPQKQGATALSPAIATYYQKVDKDRLPLSLQLDRMIIGYSREVDGPNKGQWRQQVRVFYASPYLTRAKRNDEARAENMALQFLRIHSLVQRQLGLTNLYARGDKIGGVTSLWLLEVSALWPAEDDDPSVLAQLGPRIPNPNVGPTRAASEPTVTALMKPWNVPIAANTDSSPDEILFWKAGMQRSEAEWVREIAHEYGHVALPPLGGFSPPLEPYANGLLGETLVLMWAAESPGRFSGEVPEVANSAGGLPPAPGERVATAPTDLNPTDMEDPLVASFAEHVNRQALPAIKLFQSEGPLSPLRSKTDKQGTRYLQGATVYLERVYGSSALGAAFKPLALRAANVDDPLRRRQLMNTATLLDGLPNFLTNIYGSGKSLKIWLPGALSTNMTASELIARAPAKLKAGSKTDVLLYIPPGTDSLRIDGPGVGKLQSVGFPFTTAENGCRVYFGGRSGWQNFSLTAAADAQIDGALLERK